MPNRFAATSLMRPEDVPEHDPTEHAEVVAMRRECAGLYHQPGEDVPVEEQGNV